MRWAILASTALLLSGLSTSALADEPPATAGAGATVTAQDLFEQGVALIGDEKWAEAAAKLEESNRLGRAPGTTLNLADCYEHLGKLASAWTLFTEAAGIFGRRQPPDPRAELAKKRAEALFPKLSRLTIDVPAAVRETKRLLVKRDGEEVGAAQFGTGIAVDAGTHVIEVTAPGKEGWKGEVKVGAEADKQTVTVPALKDAPEGTAGGGQTGWPWQRKAALGVAGAGVAGVALGAIFGGIALGKHGELQSHCMAGSPRVCDAEGVRLGGEIQTPGLVSTIGFAAGGALIAAGVVLWLVAPSAAPESKDSGPKAESGLKGAWIAPVIGRETGVSAGIVW